MRAYYNEIDPYAAEWLRNLIAAVHIAPGDVDERDIREVEPDDLEGYTQCHFFAGIGGWSYALRLAGWPDERPVWTGSCPCQPFSAAGKRAGTADARHLWPEFYRLIRERTPEHVIGEQVPGAIGHGWLDGVSADLEKEGYAVGSVVLGAHSLGAPHIRQRLWFVAERLDDATGPRRTGPLQPGTVTAPRNETRLPEPQRRGGLGRVAQPPGEQVGDAGLARQCAGTDIGLGDTDGARPQGRRERPDPYADQRTPWTAGQFIPCGDGKARRVEPGIFPLAHGAFARVGRLRAYGNAIVPQVAAEFIRAYREVRGIGGRL